MLPDSKRAGYDPKTLKNLPRYIHEVPLPSGAPKAPLAVDLSKLLKKFGKEGER